MTLFSTPTRRRCGSFRPGHDVHHVQARSSYGEGGRSVHASIDDDGWIVIVEQSVIRARYWNHDAADVAAALEASGGTAELRSHDIVAVPVRHGERRLFSVAETPSPCPDHQSS